MDRGSTVVIEPDLVPKDNSVRKMIFMVGCSGSGKTTMIELMRNQDPGFHYLQHDDFTFATVMPKFGIMAIGKYKDGANCGGCDAVRPQARITEALALAWSYPYDIVMEGLLILSARWLKRVEHIGEALGHRKYYVVVLRQKLEVAYERILIRNGGKDVNKNNVIQKINAGERFMEVVGKEMEHLPGAVVKVRPINTYEIAKREEMLYHFFEAIK